MMQKFEYHLKSLRNHDHLLNNIHNDYCHSSIGCENCAGTLYKYGKHSLSFILSHL